MSLAKLTVDLTANLSLFEGDMGRAAQISTRTGDALARAAQLAEKALAKQADQVGRTQAEYLALQAAQAGLGDSAKRFLDIIEKSGTATATASAKTAFSLSSAAAAAETAADRQRASNAELVKSILQINDAYQAQRRLLVEQQAGGGISTDQLKGRLEALNVNRAAAIEQLKSASAQQAAQRELEAAETAAVARRKAAFDSLRDTIAKTSFQAAQRQIADAETVANAEAATLAKRQAAFEVLRQRVSKANYEQAQKPTEADGQAAAAAEVAAKRQIAFQQLRQDIARDTFQAEQKAAAASAAAAERAATIEAATLTKRASAFEQLRQDVARSSYEEAQKQIADAQRVAEAEAATLAKRASAFEVLRQQVAKENFQQQQGAVAATAQAQEAAARKQVASNEAYIASLEREISIVGKARSEIVAMELAQRGLADRGAPLVKALQDIDAKTGQLGKGAFATRNQLLTLKYTLSDVIASAASGISPLTILLQQGGQVAQIEGGVGGVFKTVLSLITPFRLAVGGAAAAIGAFAYAAYAGAQQSKTFNDAIVLTGNYAGQTAGQFTEATRRIAESGQVSVSAAREFGQALIATGQIGPKVFEKATEVAARYGAATGQNAKDVAADFASMGADVFKWATEHNKQLNFVTAAQLEHIKRLQEQGKEVEAQGAIYDALNSRLKGLEPNLGTLDRVLRSVKTTWSEFWDAAFDIGRTETIEDKIAKARAAVANAGRIGTERVSQTQLDPERRAQFAKNAADNATPADLASENLRFLLRSQAAGQAVAANTAEVARLNKEAVGADEFVQGFERRAKAASGLKREIDAANAQFAKQDALAAKDSNYKPSSAETRAAILKKIKEDYTDKPQLSEDNQTRKALLDKDLKFIKDQFDLEKQAVQFGQEELQAVYNAGAISLKDFYDKKRSNITAGVDAELNALIDEQARLEVELEKGKFKAPADRIAVETKLQESLEKSANVKREAAQKTKIANIDEGESFRQLGNRVTEFQASLQQLAGDEAGAARLRAQTAIANAKREQTQAGGQISDEDIARYTQLTQRANEFAQAQRLIGELSARSATAEELLALRATQRGDSLEKQERDVYALRQVQLEQLGALRDRVQALADVSTDPKIIQYAADLALAYEKAADTVEPALNRIRDAGKDLADDLANNLAQVSIKFTSLQDLGKSVLQSLQSSVLKIVTAPLQKAFEGLARQGIDAVQQKSTPGLLPGEFGELGIGKGASAASGAASAAAEMATLSTATTTATSALGTASPALLSLATAADYAAAAMLRIGGGAGAGGGSFFTSTGGAPTQVGATGGLDFSGIGFPLADGTNYVPYDGFPAVLHKGEKVTPAKYNPAAGGDNGRAQIVNIHPAPGTEVSSQSQNDDGSVDVIFKQTERFIAGRVTTGRSPINKSLKQRGVNTSAGLAKRG